MGIQHLNKFLLDKCNKSHIKKTHLSALSGKTIAIDTSIYLYKFAAENTLAEHFYLMISIFRHYNIVPIFVFDGKPPKEKRELLMKRREHRKQSEEQYNKLKQELDTTAENNQELQKELDVLKRESTSISYANLATVKGIISAYGAIYLQAEGEADVLCVQLVKSEKAWGCLSDDMDMFVYGCPRIFRHLSLANHHVIMYETGAILNDLGMDIQTFREIAVLSGTDYNCDNSITLWESIRLHEEYRKHSRDVSPGGFYTWLMEKSNHIRDYATLVSIVNMFDISHYTENNRILGELSSEISLGDINMTDLTGILEPEGFVFVQ